MASEWPILTLQQAGVSLIDCDHRTPRAANEGYPYVAIPQMKNGRLNLNEARKISAADFTEWTKRALPQGYDVVLSRRCNPGETAFVEPGAKLALGQNLVLLRADGSKVYPPFLRWLVRSPDWWDQIDTFLNMGAVFDSLKCADIPKFRLSIPPLVVQRRIVDTLGALDDKIHLNRRMNATLEAMAAALFHAWFVDFEPVQAKARGATNFPLMSQSAFDLLPKKLVDAPQGALPDGWDISPLPDAIEVNPPRYLGKQAAAPYLDMANMPTQGHAPETWVERPFGSGTRFQNGDTLVARITPCLENGKTAFVDFLGDNQVGWGSTEYIVLRPRPPLPLCFAYYLARSDSFRSFAIQRMSGSSGRQRVPVDCLMQFNIAVPPAPVAEAFGRAVEPMMALVRQQVNECFTLAQLRDTMLPRLMSGEMRVPS